MAEREEREWLNLAEWDVWRNLSGRHGAMAWLAGRFLAKSLVAEMLTLRGDNRPGFDELAVLSTDARGRQNRPQVYCRGRKLEVRLSLAHSPRFVYAAAGWESGMAFGVDVAEEFNLEPAFLDTWFSGAEQEVAQEVGAAFAAIRIWTAKEACYKACQQGEAFDPRHCEVRLGRDDAGRATYLGRHRQQCHVRWSGGSGCVRALAVVENGLND